MFTKRRVLIGSIVLVLLVITAGIYFYYSNYTLIQAAPIGSGYKAQIVASGLFVSNRSLDSILNQDINIPELSIFDVEIDNENKIVSVSVNGLFKKQSIYREGLGCTLLNDGISKEEMGYINYQGSVYAGMTRPTGAGLKLYRAALRAQERRRASPTELTPEQRETHAEYVAKLKGKKRKVNLRIYADSSPEVIGRPGVSK